MRERYKNLKMADGSRLEAYQTVFMSRCKECEQMSRPTIQIFLYRVESHLWADIFRLCPNCFDNKIEPAIKLGMNPFRAQQI